MLGGTRRRAGAMEVRAAAFGSFCTEEDAALSLLSGVVNVIVVLSSAEGES